MFALRPVVACEKAGPKAMQKQRLWKAEGPKRGHVQEKEDVWSP